MFEFYKFKLKKENSEIILKFLSSFFGIANREGQKMIILKVCNVLQGENFQNL